jgi:hypothetical protein
MFEWWTYSLQDFLLFSPRTYFRLFELYNAAIWPAQILAIGLGLAIPFLLRQPTPRNSRLIATLLALAWIVVASAYFYLRYATINWIAPYFAAGFVFQGLLLIWLGLIRGHLTFALADRKSRIGLGLYLLALLIMPLLGLIFGRSLLQAELFGLAPDPTAIGTLGLLFASRGRPLIGLSIIPLAWCAISAATLWTMGSPTAWIMIAAPFVCAVSLSLRARGSYSSENRNKPFQRLDG